jgi:hypothetical protein
LVSLTIATTISTTRSTPTTPPPIHPPIWFIGNPLAAMTASTLRTHEASRCTSGNWQTSLGEELPDDTRLFR